MNLTELRSLKDGDKVVFKDFQKFTTDKEYIVKSTGVGRTVVDDNGAGRFLIEHYEQFEILNIKLKGVT